MHLKTAAFVISFIVGVFVGEKLQIATEFAVFCLVLSLVHAVLYFIFEKKNMNSAFSFFAILIFAGLFFGIVRPQFVEEKDVLVCEKTCSFLSVVINDPVKKDNFQEFEVKIIDESYKNLNYENVIIKTTLYPEFLSGDVLSLSGKVILPKNILPTEGNSKTFNYENYLKSNNVGSESFFPKIKKVEEYDGITFTLINIKNDLKKRIEKYVSYPDSSVANGILFGDASLSKEIKEYFRIAGLSHIVVLSGFNIAIAVSFVMFVFMFLPIVIRIVLTFLFVLLFVIAVGGEVTAVRAFIMATIGLLAMTFGREYIARQALLVSLFFMVLFEPQILLYSASFHLSFLATAGIIYFMPLLEKIFKNIKEVNFLDKTLLGTVAAMITTTPYIMYTFGSVSTYALITNLLIVPIVPFVMLFTFLVVISSFVNVSLATIIGVITSYLIKSVIWTAEIFASIPFALIKYDVSIYLMFFFYALVVVIYFVINFLAENLVLEEVENEEEENGLEVIKY